MAFRKKAKKASEAFSTSPESFFWGEKGEPMAMGEEMRALCESLVNSFDARVARVRALRRETAATLRGFRDRMRSIQHELRRKASDLKRSLSDAEATRMRDFRALRQDVRGRQEERNGGMASMLGGFRRMMNGFRRDHEAAANHWHHMAVTMARRRATAAR
ncbi:MAG: hypothetical protein HY724_02625 [Candidatus Rokubacteria bacterium]|nr:hypothetical protein [Candidatus Rokubacteria bacterium]